MMSGEKGRVENFTCRMSDTVDDLLKKFTDFKLHRFFIVVFGLFSIHSIHLKQSQYIT